MSTEAPQDQSQDQEHGHDPTRVSPSWPDRQLTATPSDDGEKMLFYEIGLDSEYADGGWIASDITVSTEDWR
ncbi:hypothetical protein [Haloarcula amylovorans]|uniref:hypothetical protein n=1 Tax=Haloarcula amylovorans TaxID=2562280 RepID=UPI00107636F6|nr:hypothetical protein [Halomicroarcula amylolytica]